MLSQIRLITQGTHHLGCTLLAIVHYYFAIAGSIWWVVLTIAWFLSTRQIESIDIMWPYFHFAAWGIPSIAVIVMLIGNGIDGDLYSGVCSVGNWNADRLYNLVFVPLLICIGKRLVGVSK